MSAACHQTFTGIHQAIKAKARHWSARGLSFLGRVHVAKQVLAASLWYHASFQQPPKQLLQQISRQLSQYVASAQHHRHSDAALALAQGNSQDYAALPAPAPSAALFPRVLTSSLPPAQGGVGLVEVPTQIQALQAKVVSRLLEPERLAWKVLQLHHLSNAPHTRALAYGATILFSTVSISCLQLPARVTGYVTAFKALQPHRLLRVDAMPVEDVLNEPIFFNRQVTVPLGSSATSSANGSAASRPLTPHDQPIMLAAGITKLAHLQVALQQQHPPTFTACLQSVLTAIPPPWRAVVTAAPTAPTWQQGLSAAGSQLIQNTQTGRHHSLNSHDQLQESHAQVVTTTSHVRVISWDPSRPWRSPTRQPTQSATALYSQGVVPDEEPLLEADFPLPGSLKLPTLMGSPAALARLQPAPRSDAGGLGDATPLASSSHAGVPEAASPLAGKRRGPESVSGSESSEIAEAPSVDSLAMVPMTPGEPFFFFFFFFLGGKDIHYTSAMMNLPGEVPGEPHAFSLRRSSREHKKPKPYYAGALAEPPDKLSSGKGLQRGFLK